MTAARMHLVIVEHGAPALPGLPAASHDLPDLLNGRHCDPRRYRLLFPQRWSAFLKSHISDNSVDVAYVFGVDEHCARNWLEGKTGPQGWAVDFALGRPLSLGSVPDDKL